MWIDKNNEYYEKSVRQLVQEVWVGNVYDENVFSYYRYQLKFFVCMCLDCQYLVIDEIFQQLGVDLIFLCMVDEMLFFDLCVFFCYLMLYVYVDCDFQELVMLVKFVCFWIEIFIVIIIKDYDFNFNVF